MGGYLQLSNLPVPRHLHKAAQMFRYQRRVLIAPPWPEIFSQDSERKQSFEEAVATYEAMVSTFAASGYELIPLPLTPVEERMDFVLNTIR